jgi:hypothetical protein
MTAVKLISSVYFARAVVRAERHKIASNCQKTGRMKEQKMLQVHVDLGPREGPLRFGYYLVEGEPWENV